jgi:hypothetical protein
MLLVQQPEEQQQQLPTETVRVQASGLLYRDTCSCARCWSQPAGCWAQLQDFREVLAAAGSGLGSTAGAAAAAAAK